MHGGVPASGSNSRLRRVQIEIKDICSNSVIFPMHFGLFPNFTSKSLNCILMSPSYPQIGWETLRTRWCGFLSQSQNSMAECLGFPSILRFVHTVKCLQIGLQSTFSLQNRINSVRKFLKNADREGFSRCVFRFFTLVYQLRPTIWLQFELSKIRISFCGRKKSINSAPNHINSVRNLS